MRTRSLRAIKVLCVGLLAIVSSANAHSETYPSRPINVLLGSGAGGVADTVARLYAKELTIRLGQSVLVNNMPSAYELRPAEIVAHAAPDGYTLVLASSAIVMLPYMKQNYRLRLQSDFTPIATLTNSWTVFAVNSGLPMDTLKNFVDYAKKRDGAVRYGSGGIGTAMHIAAELLELNSGTKMIHVPYASGAASLTDLLGGRIEMGSIGLASAKAVEGGGIRILAQAGPQRHPLLPDVPTAIEAGYPEVHLEYWFGLLGPPKMPPQVLSRLDAALKDISADDAFRRQLIGAGMIVDYRGPDEMARYVAAESDRWSKLIPAMHLPDLD